MRVAAVALVLGLAPAAQAARSDVGTSKTFGAGLTLGEPSGLSGKYWLAPDFAVQAAIGSSLARSGFLGAVDAVFHVRDLAPQAKVLEIGVYFGGGGALGFWRHNSFHEHDDPAPHSHRHETNDFLVYVRGIGGGAMWLRQVPIELAIELGPGLLFAPDGGRVFFSGAFAARYYF